MASLGTSFTLSSPRRVHAAIETLEKAANDPDRLWEAAVFPKGHRAVEANAKYWAILRQVSYETGLSSGDLHKFCASEFLGTKPVWVPKYEKWVTHPFSTAVLGASEFSVYLEQVQAEAIEMGAEINYNTRVR